MGRFLRKACFYAAWICLIFGTRLADWAREYKVVGTTDE